jgi:putative aldouronate transport system permease protein
MKEQRFEDIVVDTVIYMVLFFVFISTVYPFYYALIISLNNGVDALRGGIYLWPRMITLDNYKAIFSNERLVTGFAVSVARTLIGTVSTVFFSALVGYSFASKKLMFKKFYTIIVIIPMFLSGGLIPYFILLKNIGLLNSFWVYIIPGLLSVFNIIILSGFFKELPDSFKEAAKIDGANDISILFKIIFPLSMPVFATISLFTGVGHWNSWFDAAYFITDEKLKTLSFWLIDLINKSNIRFMTGDKGANLKMYQETFTPETIRMATMVVVVLPIVCVYPFLQKYFIKGIMIGGIKS